MEIKTVFAGGRIEKARAEKLERNGVPVGVVEGYLASWKLEDGPYPDRIQMGAFMDSIAEHKARGNRQVRLNYMHRRSPIGGFPIQSVKEDGRGLYGVAEINLDTQVGREAYALAQQGVLVDFSVGIDVLKKQFEKTADGQEVRVITKARLYEASLVDEPMNKYATVTAVKAAMPFANLPTAPEGTRWDPEAARERVLDLKLREADPTAAFLDRGRRWQIADVVDGALVVVPDAVAEVAAELKREGVEDRELLSHLDRYCGRLGVDSPFPSEADRKSIRLEEVKGWGVREIEAALAETGRFSRSAAKFLASKFSAPVAEAGEAVWSDVLGKIREAESMLAGRQNQPT